MEKNVESSFYGKNIIISGKYPAIYMPEHHLANNSGIVYLHFIAAEQKLGRPLREKECVHHVNEDKNDYSEDNLWIFASKNDHVAYHRMMKSNSNFELKRVNGIYYCHTYAEECPLCGKKKDKSAKLCINCYKKTVANIPSKEDLESLLYVKNMSNTEISRLYGVSHTTIRRWRKRYNL